MHLFKRWGFAFPRGSDQYKDSNNDYSKEDSLSALLCRESILSSDEDEDPEGDLVSMPGLHNTCIGRDSDSEGGNDSSGDDGGPPYVPPLEGLPHLRLLIF
jgi:hypothetical protein